MAILFALLLTLPSFAENKVETLAAVVSESCAPWDGAARLVQVEKLELTVNLYEKDITAFESGTVVRIKKTAQGSESTAQVKKAGARIPWERVDVEIQENPKSGIGNVTVNGSAHPLKFEHKKREKRMFCG
ncbi:MAG TPA: hypothetical protein VIH99_11550 [Bdellovibrionota bacterium]|jgi:hypothetical protein